MNRLLLDIITDVSVPAPFLIYLFFICIFPHPDFQYKIMKVYFKDVQNTRAASVVRCKFSVPLAMWTSCFGSNAHFSVELKSGDFVISGKREFVIMFLLFSSMLRIENHRCMKSTDVFSQSEDCPYDRTPLFVLLYSCGRKKSCSFSRVAHTV